MVKVVKFNFHIYHRIIPKFRFFKSCDGKCRAVYCSAFPPPGGGGSFSKIKKVGKEIKRRRKEKGKKERKRREEKRKKGKETEKKGKKKRKKKEKMGRKSMV